MNNYFMKVGRINAGEKIRKSKPKNVTPAGKGRPYCRHKEFQKMPQYNIETVSIIALVQKGLCKKRIFE